MKTATLLALSATATLAADIRMVGTNCYDITAHPKWCRVSGRVCAVSSNGVVISTNWTDLRSQVVPSRYLAYGGPADQLKLLAQFRLSRSMNLKSIDPMAGAMMGLHTEYYSVRMAQTNYVLNFQTNIGARVTLHAIPTSTRGVYDFGNPVSEIPPDADRYFQITSAGIKPRKTDTAKLQDAATAEQRLITWQLTQASNGLDYVQFDIAQRYLSGDGLPQDPQLALHWIRAAATNQFQPAIQYLATNQPPISPQPLP